MRVPLEVFIDKSNAFISIFGDQNDSTVLIECKKSPYPSEYTQDLSSLFYSGSNFWNSCPRVFFRFQERIKISSQKFSPPFGRHFFNEIEQNDNFCIYFGAAGEKNRKLHLFFRFRFSFWAFSREFFQKDLEFFLRCWNFYTIQFLGTYNFWNFYTINVKKHCSGA